MQVKVLAFGQVAGITGAEFTMNVQVDDTDALRSLLADKYPILADVPFAVAVDKKLVQQNTTLTPQSTIALLPPFSGG